MPTLSLWKRSDDLPKEKSVMKFFDTAGFPNPRRVRIAFAEKGVTDKFENIQVDLLAGQHRTPEFRAMNPDASVPFVELDDGTYISQCTPIIEYLDSEFGGEPLTGRTAKERAVIHMMNRRAEAGLMDAGASYFHHATPGLGPDIEIYQNEEWGLKQKELAQKTLSYLDAVLANQPFIAGENFSMADITAIAGVDFAEFAQIEFPDGLSNLAQWRDRIHARPGCVA
jgi:glutathione S-transferase